MNVITLESSLEEFNNSQALIVKCADGAVLWVHRGGFIPFASVNVFLKRVDHQYGVHITEEIMDILADDTEIQEVVGFMGWMAVGMQLSGHYFPQTSQY